MSKNRKDVAAAKAAAAVEAERRAEDQDAAVEEAFVAGTLPEVDRRDDQDKAKLLDAFLSMGDGSSLEVRTGELRIRKAVIGNPQFIHASTAGRPVIEAVRELLEQI